ncbi:MAG: tRNA (adenosine(37)-N6)-threonylcarbamoyltransferase complex ATPase subunit type 1 TsaE [Acidobacteria bacterium]|nr:tRNA (adenosine(37)-N6)-threonylcarbamoyltransferase complex ATPase subunit type 1 TsaE [Acidobacteriota bacterium]
MRRWLCRTVEETRALGEELAAELAPRGVLLLHGDLGSGKTVLTQGVARGLGIRPDDVQSPTYTLVQEHRGPGGRLIHMDLYRLEGPELDSLGLDDLLEGDGVKVVEWAERLPWSPPDSRRLRLRRGEDGGRVVEES